MTPSRADRCVLFGRNASGRTQRRGPMGQAGEALCTASRCCKISFKRIRSLCRPRGTTTISPENSVSDARPSEMGLTAAIKSYATQVDRLANQSIQFVTDWQKCVKDHRNQAIDDHVKIKEYPGDILKTDKGAPSIDQDNFHFVVIEVAHHTPIIEGWCRPIIGSVFTVLHHSSRNGKPTWFVTSDWLVTYLSI